MPFADPNEYFRTHSQQTANIANMRSQRRNDWFKAMQPVYDMLKQWQADTGAMGRQKEGQRFEVEERIPAETEAQGGLYELQARLQAESPLTKATVEETRKRTAGLPTAEEATAERKSQEALRAAQAASYMSAADQMQLDRERMRSAEKIAGMNASNKDDKELTSRVTQYLGMMAARGLIPTNPTTGAPDFLAFDKDPEKTKKIAQLTGQLFDRYLDDNNWLGDRGKARAFLDSYLAGYTQDTGAGSNINKDKAAGSLMKAADLDRSTAYLILDTAAKILNAGVDFALSPLAAAGNAIDIALFTRPSQQIPKARNWLNAYFPGRLGDRLFPPEKPQTPKPPASGYSPLQEAMQQLR